MADDIQITVGVTGEKNILNLANAVNILGKNSEKLAKQLDNNRINDAAYEKGIQQQIKALVKLKVSVADAEKFIRSGASATLKSIEADKASKAAKEALITSQKKADTAFALAIQKEKEMADAEKDLIASRARLDATAKQEAVTLDQLKMKYQAGYAEMQIYKAENEQLNLAYKQNILTTEQLKVEQDKLNTSFATGTGVFATHANQARSSASRLGVVYQQAGYQAGDFFVQVQSGTSILTAFSQQATQMVGMMYLIPEAGMAAVIPLKLLGITASITMAQLTLGLSIAIPVITSLASLFWKMSESNDKANKSAKTSVDVFERLAQATHQLWVERMKLTDPKFDENLVGTQDELKRLKDAYNAAASEAQRLKDAQVQSITGALAAGQAQYAAKAATKVADAAVKKAEAELKSYEIEKALAYANDRIAASLAARAEQHLKDLEAQQNLQDEFNRKLAKAHEIYAKTRLEAAGIARETANAVNALNQMKIEFSPGGQAMMKYGSRSPTLTSEQQAFADRNTPKNISVVGSSGGGGGGAGIGGETQEEYIAKLVREYDMKKKSLGLTDEQVKRTEFLFSLDEKLADMKTKRSEVEIQTEKQRAIAAYDAYAAAEKQAATMDMISSNLNTAFMSMIDGSQTVAGAFQNMMYNILKSVYEQSITQPLANGITGFLKSFLGGGGGGTGSMGLPMPFAKGGVVGSATTFQTSGGRMGLMGEAGPEAIMPLKRGSNGKLGVQVDGNSGGSVVVNQTFNFSANGDESVKKIIAQAAPQIAQMTQQKIMDSRRRGGSMKAAFG